MQSLPKPMGIDVSAASRNFLKGVGETEGKGGGEGVNVPLPRLSFMIWVGEL